MNRFLKMKAIILPGYSPQVNWTREVYIAINNVENFLNIDGYVDRW